MKTIIYKQSDSCKLLTAADVLKLENICEYQQKIAVECEQLKENALKQAQLIEVEARKKIEDDLAYQSNKLYEHYDAGLKQLYIKLEKNTYKIVYQVLKKLNLSISKQELCREIHSEILEYIIDNNLTIKCNSAALGYLKSELVNFPRELNITFEVDDRLSGAQAVILDSKVCIYVDLELARDEIINKIVNLDKLTG